MSIVKFARQYNKMTQAQFADKLGVRVQYVSAMERGVRSPRKKLRDMCKHDAARQALLLLGIDDHDSVITNMIAECQE